MLITGAGGYLGSQLLAALAELPEAAGRITALDVREVAPERRLPGVDYRQADVRSPELADIFKQAAPDVVVHLASIVTPGKDSNRDFEYSVDVGGTENVLKASLAAGCDEDRRHLVGRGLRLSSRQPGLDQRGLAGPRQ